MIPPPTATWPHCAGPHQFRARTRDRTRPAQEDRKRGEGHFQSPEALQHIGQRGGSGRGTKRHKQNGQRVISSTLQGFLHFEYACGPAFHVSRLRVIFVAICPNIPAMQLFWHTIVLHEFHCSQHIPCTRCFGFAGTNCSYWAFHSPNQPAQNIAQEFIT